MEEAFDKLFSKMHYFLIEGLFMTSCLHQGRYFGNKYGYGVLIDRFIVYPTAGIPYCHATQNMDQCWSVKHLLLVCHKYRGSIQMQDLWIGFMEHRPVRLLSHLVQVGHTKYHHITLYDTLKLVCRR